MKNNIVLGLLAAMVIAGGYWVTASEFGRPEAPLADTNQMGNTNSGENPGEGDQVHNLPVEPAAAKARADLAAKLGVGEKNIVIMKVEEKTWSDGCLGLGGPAESCLMALVDGFRVEMTANGKDYVYRTDKTGMALRME